MRGNFGESSSHVLPFGLLAAVPRQIPRRAVYLGVCDHDLSFPFSFYLYCLGSVDGMH